MASLTRAAVYCRISEDQDDEQLGVKRQAKDCLGRVRSEGWTLVPDGPSDTFSDNDISGAKDATERAAFGRLTAAIQAGRVDVVVAYKQSRVFRDTTKFLAFCEQARLAGVRTLAFVADPDADLNGPMLVPTVLAAVDAEYRRSVGELGRRKKLELAERGMPSGGGIRAFGYNWPHRVKGTKDRYVEPDPTAEPYSVYEPEAQAIRWAYKHLMEDGGTLTGVRREWIARGLVTVRGGVLADGTPAWRRNAIRRILTGPRIAGLRVHKGEVFGDASWEPIVDRQDWTAVNALLNDPSRRTFSTPPRQYPLRGMVTCAKCGRRMSGLARKNSGKHVRFYACRKENGACGETWITAHNVERWVIGLVVGVAESSDAMAMIDAESGVRADELQALRAERDETQAKLNGLEDKWADDTISADAYNRNRKAFQKAVTAAQDRIAAIEAGTVLGQVDGSLLASWDNLTFSDQHKVITSLVSAISVTPWRKKGRNVFDPSRVHISWRSSALAMAAGLDEADLTTRYEDDPEIGYHRPDVVQQAVANVVAWENVQEAVAGKAAVPSFAVEAMTVIHD